MASGNHVYKGICADLPVQPRKSNSVITVIVVPPAVRAVGACAKTVSKSREPVAQKIMNIATMNPKSPMRFMMKALRPAFAFASSVNQNPMSR